MSKLKSKLCIIIAAALSVNVLSGNVKTFANQLGSVPKAHTEPEKWEYFGGDEFNDNKLDLTKWGIFDNNGIYGQPQGMIQYYNASQVREITENGEGILKVVSERTNRQITTNEGLTLPAWNSGFINSSGQYATNKPKKFYPLYFRLDMRAKIANELGFWHGLWLTHYDGAKVAELDLGEFFVAANKTKDAKNRVTQTIHLWNNSKNTVEKNLPRGLRTFTVPGSVQDEFKVYSVSVEPSNKINEAIISFWVEGKKTYSFSTDSLGDNLLNKFITKTKQDNREMNTWNIMFQGGVGSDQRADVGYPTSNITSLSSSIDYIRVFTPKPEVNIWKQNGEFWQYIKSDGKLATSEWLKLKVEGSEEYVYKYFDANSNNVNQMYIDKNGQTTEYYMSIRGPQNGYHRGWWLPSNGKRYYFDLVTAKRVSGKVEIDGGIKYFNPYTGAQGFGRQYVENKWQYFNPITGNLE